MLWETQELINHRLAHIFICGVKHKHSNTLLRCTSKLSFSSAPINGQFSVVPPSFTTLQMHSLQAAKEKKENTSLAFRAASRCENKPTARRRDEEEGEGKGERKEEEEVRYATPQLRPWV